MARTGRGAEGRLNMAAAAQPKSGHMKPAGPGGGPKANAGPERPSAKAMDQAGAGSVVGRTDLGHAMGHLADMHHDKHMPLGGLKPTKSW